MSLQSPDTSDFLEALPSRWTRSLIWVFLVMVAALAAWAAASPVDVSVSGRGTLVPASPPTWARSPVDGALHEVRVHGGDAVSVGDVLFTVQGHTVTSPLSGWVAEVRLTSGTVSNGDPVVAICGQDTPFAFEAMVANRDISKVTVGQKALVHLDAFPVEHFGSLPAEVLSIEPVLDAPDHPFRVLLRLGRQVQVGPREDVRHLLPALTGEAELIIGQQSLLELILRPTQ